MPKPLSRRTFLRGVGTAMALPLLDAMMPRSAFAAPPAGSTPNRLVVFYVPNGIHMPGWTPQAQGANFDLPPILEALSPHKNDLLVLSGLDNLAAIDPGVPGDHARGTGSFLTCAPVFKTEGANIQNGVSIDQHVAQNVGGLTAFPSLELGSEGGGSTGGCDSGYSCAYSRNISWSDANSPVAKEISPHEAFDRLFAGKDTSMTPEQAAIRRQLKLSVLDFVLDDAKALHAKLGQRDREKLDEYMTAVNELEKRLNKPPDPNECVVGPKPSITLGLEGHVKLMMDIMVLAMRCDQTRVMTYMLGNAGSNRTYNFLGITEGHHYLSHHENNPAKQAKLQTINIWEVEQLAYLLTEMKKVEEVDGNLLDHSMVFFSSECEDGNAHRHKNLPVIVAGRGNGALSPGRHIHYDGAQPIADLYISMMNAMGVPETTFGQDGTAPLTGLSG